MFKKIKSLFIEEDPNAVSSNKETPVSENSQTKIKDSIPAETYSTQNMESLDPKFIDILMKAVETNNKEGFDYLEFKNSLQSLSKLNMDEATRYKSAFVMGKTMGLTKEELLQSVQGYIAVINQEESKFKEALQKQKALQVKGKEDQLISVQNGISQKQKQVEQLIAEIEQNKTQMDKIKTEMNDAVVRIDQTNSQFMAAHKLISQQMLDDVQKIKSFIE